jgi:hypothetical protein
MPQFFKSLKLTSLLVILLHSLGAEAQVNNYNFFVLNRQFEFLTDSVSLNEGTTWDDPEFSIPLAFPLVYMGNPVETLYCSSFGLGAIFADNPGIQGTANLLIACGADLVDRAYDFENGTGSGSLSPYSYKVEGVSPNRIVKIEIRNAGFYNSLSDNVNDDQFMNLQLWLYEIDNAIEIVFGPVNITSPQTVFDGETGTYVGMLPQFNVDSFTVSSGSFLLAGPVQKPSPVAINSVEQIVVLDGVIPESTVYRFEPVLNSIGKNPSGIAEIWPNPASEFIQIKASKQNLSKSKVEISDSSGKLVLSYPNADSPISINSLNSGLYFIRIYNPDGISTGKFIKM